LQKKIGRVKFVGYYPNGFGSVIRHRAVIKPCAVKPKEVVAVPVRQQSPERPFTRSKLEADTLRIEAIKLLETNYGSMSQIARKLHCTRNVIAGISHRWQSGVYDK
jgi:hypothetical protein